MQLEKGNFLLGVLVLFTTSFAGVETAKASPAVMVDKPWYRVTGVNQPVEFTASASGGTPPYIFQWYTTFLDPTISPEQWNTIMVPDSNSSTFNFVASTPGRYGISIRLSDSNGDGEYQSFQPIGIVVTVQSSPVPQSTLSPSPSPSSASSPSTTLTPTPSIPEVQPWTILFLLSAMMSTGLLASKLTSGKRSQAKLLIANYLINKFHEPNQANRAEMAGKMGERSHF